MFTSLLLFVSSLCAFQDAGTAPPAAAPAAPAATAPAQTSEKVRAYLMEAEGHLYDPQAAGLKSLEFDSPVNLPAPFGEVGKVHVTWVAGAEPTTKFMQKDGLQLPAGIPPAMLEQSGDQLGHQLVDFILNRPISQPLKDAVATMEPPQDGLVKVNFASEKAAAQGVKSQALFFNDDGVLQKQVLVLDMASQGAPGMTVPVNQNYTWKPVTKGNDLLITDKMTAEADLGMMGKQKTTMAFTYRTVDNIVLVTGMTMTSEAPAGMGGGTQNVEAQNLVVNGKPAPEAPAPPAGG